MQLAVQSRTEIGYGKSPITRLEAGCYDLDSSLGLARNHSSTETSPCNQYLEDEVKIMSFLRCAKVFRVDMNQFIKDKVCHSIHSSKKNSPFDKSACPLQSKLSNLSPQEPIQEPTTPAYAFTTHHKAFK
jgi:hypothetical protein